MRSIITIGRQFGSGGREIGKRLSEELDIPYYDKLLLTIAAKESGICQELFEHHDEKYTGSFLFSLYSGFQIPGGPFELPLNQKVSMAQFDAIRSVAAKGPCIIVGRCADYVLRDHPNVVNVFIKADMAYRVAHAVQEHGVDPTKAEDIVRKQDKQRASYYNYYANTSWGDLNQYDLCLDTGKLGIDGSVKLLKEYIALREART